MVKLERFVEPVGRFLLEKGWIIAPRYSIQLVKMSKKILCALLMVEWVVVLILIEPISFKKNSESPIFVWIDSPSHGHKLPSPEVEPMTNVIRETG